jgi:hypothetical protein
MLQNTFIHVPRITRNTEVSIWKNKIHTWNDFLNKSDKLELSSSKKSLISNTLHNSIDALKKKKFEHFSNIPQNQHWRLYNELKEHTCFLDIETTGLSKHYNNITLIGIHGNEGTKIFQNGKNLDKFQNELNKYSMMVTFNGRCFDIPFIQAKFPDLELPQYHSDLRFMMAELGLRGGLKSIERQRGITRDEELAAVDGFEAVRLWHKYQRGDNNALITLKNYLTADVENLKTLMTGAFTELKKKNFYDMI